MSEEQSVVAKHILLFDADPADIELCIHALMKAVNCNVTVAQSPSAFRDAIARQRPDIIISDSGVLGMDALQAMKLAKEKWPGILFIICSGNEAPERIKAAVAAGVDSYVGKDDGYGLLVRLIKVLNKQ